MGIGANELIQALVVIAICFLIFMALRWFFCWYWKINQIVDLLTKIEANLQSQNVTTTDASALDILAGRTSPGGG